MNKWGWNRHWEKLAHTQLDPTLTPARITAVFNTKFLLCVGENEMNGEVTGRFRHEVKTNADYPAVGDWVGVKVSNENLALIHQVLPRHTVLSRKNAGETVEEQVIATNVDVAFVVTAYDHDFNPRRLERYVATIRQTRIDPVILLNKSDLASPHDERLEQARAINPNGAVHSLCAQTGEGLDAVRTYLEPGVTGIFLGSSGVGKSSLLNTLSGSAIQNTQEVRASDSKGRHTTTTRQLFLLPSGGLVIDSPGLRELQLWADEQVLTDVYDDITQAAQSCRFRNCQHAVEPQCGVRTAIESGVLSQQRFEGYLKLQKELAYLQRKQDPLQQQQTKRHWKNIHQTARERIKDKRKNKD